MEPPPGKGGDKPSMIQVAGVTATVSLLAAGVVGYVLGYYGGQEALKSEIRNSFAKPFEHSVPAVGDNRQNDVPQPIWDVREEKSPLDDSRSVTLSMSTSKPSYNSFGNRQSAELIIRCKEGSTDLFIALDEYLGSDPVAVIYRIDKKSSQTDRWSVATSGRAVFAPAPENLAKDIALGKQFFARVADFQGTSYDLEFDVKGLATVLPRVASACKWP